MKNHFHNPALFSLDKIQDRGTNSETIFTQNRRLILKLIKNSDVITRKEIIEKTGLKGATITIIINEFLESGIIKKIGLMEGTSGRRVMGFRFASEDYCTISIRISVSYIKVGVYDLNNQNLYIKKIFFDTLSNINNTCDLIVDEVEAAKETYKDKTVIGVGVGVEGPYVIQNGYYKLWQPRNTEEYFDIGKVLAEKIPYPILINKSNNFAVYNSWKNESKNTTLGIHVNISVSNTIACGIIYNGEIVNGCSGTVGLLGNFPVFQGNMEEALTLNDVCSSSAIVNKVYMCLDEYPNSSLQAVKENLNIRDVINAFINEDELGVRIFTEAGIHLGKAVGIIVNLLNPDYIYIGDELPLNSKMHEIIEEEAKRYCKKSTYFNLHLDKFDFEQSRDSKLDSTLMGASAYVADAFLQSMMFTNEENH